MKSSKMNQAQPTTTTTEPALRPVSAEKTATGVFDTWIRANLWETQTFTTELQWGVRYSQSDPLGLAAGMNLFGYVAQNPFIRTDPLGLAYFAKRPLSGTPWMGPGSCNPFDDWQNTEIAHEQLFFEDGKEPGNLGFFNDGLVREDDPTNMALFRQCGKDSGYNDCIMRKAVKNISAQCYRLLWTGEPIGKFNCQDWADVARDAYKTLAEDPEIQEECKCSKK